VPTPIVKKNSFPLQVSDRECFMIMLNLNILQKKVFNDSAKLDTMFSMIFRKNIFEMGRGALLRLNRRIIFVIFVIR